MVRYLHFVQLLIKSSRALAILQNLALGRKPSKQFWTWEVYGLGHAKKDLLGISQYKSLNCGSDHGVHLETDASAEETMLGSDLFVTWSKWRSNLKFQDGRRVVQIQHPWISYSKKHRLRKQLRGGSKGTLAFVPHSVPGMESESFSLTDYVKEVLSLPAGFHPISFCFHVHDINFRTMLVAAKMGIRVETVGAPLSPYYVRRFYKLIRGFRFATSPGIGSQLFYCQELGLEYFIFDPSRKFQRRPLGYGGPEQSPEVEGRIRELFTLQGISEHKEEKSLIVSDALGLNIPDSKSFPIEEVLLSHGRANSWLSSLKRSRFQAD